MMELSSKIVEVVEKNDFCLEDVEEQDGKFYVEINNCTPCGEDWWEIIWFDGTDKGFIKAVRDRANYFDIDEEAEVWIEGRGENGVPDSIKAIVGDAEWKKSTLQKLADDLENLNFGTDTYGLSDQAQNIIDDCLEKFECLKSDNGMK